MTENNKLLREKAQKIYIEAGYDEILKMGITTEIKYLANEALKASI